MNITKEQVLENIEEVKKYISEIDNKKEEKVIGIEIKNRWTGDIIFTSTKTTYKEAVEEAVKSEANLSYANLSEANLSYANLSEANLSNANLSEANLSEADLFNANLSEANLSEADLFNANLSEANLFNANLSKAKIDGCLFYMGNGNKNFEALCKAIKTLRHSDGKFEDLVK